MFNADNCSTAGEDGIPAAIALNGTEVTVTGVRAATVTSVDIPAAGETPAQTVTGIIAELDATDIDGDYIVVNLSPAAVGGNMTWSITCSDYTEDGNSRVDGCAGEAVVTTVPTGS